MARRLGKYEVVREIGSGGMAVVYEAIDPDLGRRVAVKVLSGEPGEKVVRRLHQEAAIAAKLQHPNIVTIHEIGMFRDPAGGECHFIAMDYVEGRTLADLLHDKAVPRADALRMIEEIARAAAYAHSHGVIHRDLKPANILVDKNGRVLLTDFGLAHADSVGERLTRTDAVMGTPHYMAPEQVEGRQREIDGRTDVYALGVILYEALTGRTPFDGTSAAVLYQQILTQDPSRPSSLAPMESDFEIICIKAMEKDRLRRFATALDFADDLSRARRGEPIRARPPTLVYRLQKRARRHAAPLGAIALISVVGAAIWIASTLSRSSRLRSLLSDAAALESAGETLRARDAFRAALDLDPVRDEARRGFDRLDAELKRHADALKASQSKMLAHEEANKLIEAGRPALDRARSVLYSKDADYAELVRHVDEGQRLLEQAVAKAPNFALAHYQLGRAWEIKGSTDEAEACWRRALALDKTLAPAHYQLGRLLAMRSYLATIGPSPEEISRQRPTAERLAEEAASELDAATSAGSGFDEALQRQVALGLLAYIRRQGDAMEKLINDGIARFKGREGVEELHWLAGLYDEARSLEHLDTAIAIRPKFPQALFTRALARQAAGNETGALADYDALLAVSPRFVNALVNRSILRRKHGNAKASLADIDEALRLQPNYVIAILNRAATLEVLGDMDGALRAFNEGIRLEPDRAEAYVNRGGLHSLCGRTDDALRDYATAIRLKPGSAFAFYNRGTLHHRLADKLQREKSAAEADVEWSLALADYDEAVKLDSTMVEPRVNRSIVRRMRGDLEGAIADCDAVIRSHPELPDGWYHRGSTLWVKRDYDAAIADLEKALEIAPTGWRNIELAKQRLADAKKKRGS